MHSDGTGALVDLLVEQAEFLSGEREEVSSGTVHHVLYHLYNYLLAERLLAPDPQEIVADLEEVMSELEEPQPDLRASKLQLDSLCERLEGNDSPPSID